jgi:hypothetical protein
MRDELEHAIANLINQADLTVDWMDEQRRAWGDEGFMRRRRDMLDAAVRSVKSALPTPATQSPTCSGMGPEEGGE